MPLASLLVRLYAALLLGLGLTGLFAPELAGAEPLWLAQVLAGALLGLASQAWLVRGAPLGGIYGRPVVGGQQAFAFIGALVAVREVPGAPGPWRWALLATLGFGAILWSVLLYRPGWLGAPGEGSVTASLKGSPPRDA